MSDTTALTAALIDIEHFVAKSGWDQPVRLFALVDTDAFIAKYPDLAKSLGLKGSQEGGVAGALTSVEQEGFNTGADLGESLAQIMWPDTVAGCAVVVERAFLPAGVDIQLPDDPMEAGEMVAHHKLHDELRVVAGALRQDRMQHAIARVRSNDELLGGPTLAPNLTAALVETLLPDSELEN